MRVEPAVSFAVLAHDWGYHTSSAQQLAFALAERHDVLWVNSVGMRRPSWNVRDLKRLVQKGMLDRPVVDHGPIHVASVRVLPLHHIPAVRRFNRLMIRQAAARWEAARALEGPVVLCCVPTALDVALALRPRLLIYYCLDDFSTLPGIDWDMVGPYEEELLEQADVLLVTSPQLLAVERLAAHAPRLFRHGVDFDRFARAAALSRSAWPESLRDLPRPVLGFTGTLDERIDVDLLRRIAEEIEGTLLLVGGTTVDLRPVERLPNVVRFDYVPYEEVYRYLAACDVLLAPYVQGRHTQTLEPLKLREYLATGRPIVASPLPAFLDYADVLTVAESPDAFLRAIQAHLADEGDRQARQARARAESWSARARDLEALIAEQPWTTVSNGQNERAR